MNRIQMEKTVLADILEVLKQDVLKSEAAFAAIHVNANEPGASRDTETSKSSTLISISIEILKSKLSFGECSIPTCKRSAIQKSSGYLFCDKHGQCQFPSALASRVTFKSNSF